MLNWWLFEKADTCSNIYAVSRVYLYVSRLSQPSYYVILSHFLSWGKWSSATINHSWVRIQWNTEFTLNHPADPLLLSQNSVSWSITYCHSHWLVRQMLLHTGMLLIRDSMQLRKVQSLSVEITTTASSQIVVLRLLPVPCSTSLGTGKYYL